MIAPQLHPESKVQLFQVSSHLPANMSGSIAPRGTNTKTGGSRPPGPDWEYIKKYRQKGDVKRAFEDPNAPTNSENKNDHTVGTKAAYCSVRGPD